MSIQWFLNSTHKLSFNVLEHIQVLLFYSFILNNKQSEKIQYNILHPCKLIIEIYLERDSYLFPNSNSEKEHCSYLFSNRMLE